MFLSNSFSIYIIQIDQYHIHPPSWLPMNMTSQSNETRPQYIENNKHCQTFVYDADEVSLEALLDPNFRPLPVVEQQQQQQHQQQRQQQYQPQPPPPPQQQVYYEIYQRPQRSWSTTRQTKHYERASFDPFRDLPPVQPFSTMPTRRRQNPVLNNLSIIHL